MKALSRRSEAAFLENREDAGRRVQGRRRSAHGPWPPGQPCLFSRRRPAGSGGRPGKNTPPLCPCTSFHRKTSGVPVPLLQQEVLNPELACRVLTRQRRISIRSSGQRPGKRSTQYSQALKGSPRLNGAGGEGPKILRLIQIVGHLAAPPTGGFQDDHDPHSRAQSRRPRSSEPTRCLVKHKPIVFCSS